MENKIIVTIGRQFGSGGREIGQKIAEPARCVKFLARQNALQLPPYSLS